MSGLLFLKIFFLYVECIIIVFFFQITWLFNQLNVSINSANLRCHYVELPIRSFYGVYFCYVTFVLRLLSCNPTNKFKTTNNSKCKVFIK